MTCIAAQEEEAPGYCGDSCSSSSCSCSSNFTILSVNLIYAQTHSPNNETEHCIISMETSERKDILHKSRAGEGRKRKERERERDLESVPAVNGPKAMAKTSTSTSNNITHQAASFSDADMKHDIHLPS